jgi:hypothetical protein
MTINKINGITCVFGNRKHGQRYYPRHQKLYTTGYCPVCLKSIVCEFYDHNIPKWIIDGGQPMCGTFIVNAINNTENDRQCILYHRFLVTYIGIESYRHEFKYIDHYFNLVVPYISPITSLIIEQFKILRWYELELSKIFNVFVTLEDDRQYLKNIILWDNPFKCELMIKISQKLNSDVVRKILSYIDWTIFDFIS